MSARAIEYYQDMAKRIAGETPGAFHIDQFSNPANPATHEAWTAPEIWEQMEQRLDAVMRRRHRRHIDWRRTIHAANGARGRDGAGGSGGSVLADIVTTGTHGEAGSWLVEGIGEDFVPPNCDLGLVHKAYSIPDAESLMTARELLKRRASWPALRAARCSPRPFATAASSRGRNAS